MTTRIISRVNFQLRQSISFFMVLEVDFMSKDRDDMVSVFRTNTSILSPRWINLCRS